MAQQNAHVPKFGNWDNDGNVPYTLYFENARKGKGGKMINPNDPAENPEAFSINMPPSGHRAPSSEAPRTQHERRRSRDGGSDATLSPNPYSAAAGSPYHRYAGGEQKRRGGQSSPMHPYGQSAAEFSESDYGLVPNSVDRSRAKGGSRGNETPTRGSAVPKFGDWDSNPASADGYTHIFDKVREEKQSHTGKPLASGKDAAHGNGSKRQNHGDGSSSCSCFGWCK